MAIQLKRACASRSETDGQPVIVDRLWPRGIAKARLRLDRWAKQLGPGTELRRWIHHDMSRWAEYRRRYLNELDSQASMLAQLQQRARAGNLTLVFASRDPEHNHAAVLKEWLEGS